MSSGGGQQTTTTQVVRDPVESQMRNDVMATALGNFKRKEATGYQYGGPRPVGMSGNTEQGLGSLVDAAAAIGQNNQTAQGANNFQMNGAIDVDNNPYLKKAMDAATVPLIQQFMEAGGPLQAIRNGAVASGGMGGSRQGIAEGLALGKLGQTVANTRATMASDAYTQGLDTQTAGIKNQAMLNMMQSMPGELLTKVGGRHEQQAADQEAYRASAWDYQTNGPTRELQNWANIVYGNNNAGSQVTQNVPKQDHTAQIAGTVGMMALMAMMSDSRLKTEIKRVGTHAKGFGIYTYKMFGIPQWGVMAQEVRRLFPAAVRRMPSGYLAVDYRKIL